MGRSRSRSRDRSRRSSGSKKDRKRSRSRDRSRKKRSRSPERPKQDKKAGGAADGESLAARRERARARIAETTKAQSSPKASAVPEVSQPIAKTKEELEREKEEAKEREQAALEAEMQKRRDRVAAWRTEQAKKKAVDLKVQEELEEKEREAAKKKWSLDDEDMSDDELPPVDAAAVTMADPPLKPLTAGGDEDDEGGSAAAPAAAESDDDDEVDPLEAFMMDNEKQHSSAVASSVQLASEISMSSEMSPKKEMDAPTAMKTEDAAADTSPAVKKEAADSSAGSSLLPKKPVAKKAKKGFSFAFKKEVKKEVIDSESSDEEEGEESDDDSYGSWHIPGVNKMKKKDLKRVNHNHIEYLDFRKNFYIESRDIKARTDADIKAFHKAEEVKVRGLKPPKPITGWHQCGLSDRILKVIAKHEWDEPLPVQSVCIPIIMSGRDCIGCAKTGSGKTLAFVLPLMRHVLDAEANNPLQPEDGPIGLIMAPTRELAIQLYTMVKMFTKPLDLRVASIYGGAGMAEQIAALMYGVHIIVCTPGRMIDLLTANSGRVTNLQRITYVCLDEADRMFDMGFEPQIMKIIMNTRPDRQTVLFSATFPPQVESLAKQVLERPIEITIGGRSTVNNDVKQIIEVRSQETKFHRLLQLLGTWYETGSPGRGVMGFFYPPPPPPLSIFLTPFIGF
jgi:ATP-dependent RNA helicase DDX46/PRP5